MDFKYKKMNKFMKMCEKYLTKTTKERQLVTQTVIVFE